jgi:hypothetical protein
LLPWLYLQHTLFEVEVPYRALLDKQKNIKKRAVASDALKFNPYYSERAFPRVVFQVCPFSCVRGASAEKRFLFFSRGPTGWARGPVLRAGSS